MESLIVRILARAVSPIILVFSFYLFLRGHDAPGGGFIAALVALTAIVLQAYAFGFFQTLGGLRHAFENMLVIGLLTIVLSGLVGVFKNQAFLTHFYQDFEYSQGNTISLSTTLLFDLGVYLVVIASLGLMLGFIARATE